MDSMENHSEFAVGSYLDASENRFVSTDKEFERIPSPFILGCESEM